jgi:hypothetical protein
MRRKTGIQPLMDGLLSGTRTGVAGSWVWIGLGLACRSGDDIPKILI